VERTLVLVKPDAMQRGLAGEVLARLERRGLCIAALRLLQVDEALARRLYAVHEGKPFYEGLIAYITACPIVAAVFEGPRAVEAVRATLGATDPVKAGAGSIRGDLGLDIGRNVVHGSDSPENAEKEIALFFKPGDILSYERVVDRWVRET
jgi:nucleoside-diphosphate kinase